MTQPNDNKNQASDVVEAVAVAMCEADEGEPYLNLGGGSVWHNYIPKAKAAINAYQALTSQSLTTQVVLLQAQLTAAQNECERLREALEDIAKLCKQNMYPPFQQFLSNPPKLAVAYRCEEIAREVLQPKPQGEK